MKHIILFTLFILFLSINPALSQGFIQTVYGTVQAKHFGYTKCNKPFDMAVYTNGDVPINGTFTVTYNPSQFTLTNAGSFQAGAGNTLTASVNSPTHVFNELIFSGTFAQGATATSFTVSFTGVIGNTTQTISNNISTPTFANIGGLLSANLAPVGVLEAPNMNGMTTTPQFVSVGNLIIDIPNYTFAPGSELLMGKSGSNIVVESGTTLKFIQTEVYGCNTLWDKIQVKSGGSLSLNGSFVGETTIENAQNAVVLENGSKFSSFWSSFKNNKTGILVNPNNGILQNIDMSITRTTFSGNGPLYDGTQPLRAMLLNDLNTINLPFLFGGPFALGSRINGFKNGIEAANAKVTMQGVMFSNITENGIIANNNSSITYDGLGFGVFDNMLTGIKVTHSDLVVTRAEIKNVGTGIRCEQSLGDQTNINKNKINASMYGIRVFGDSNADGNISENNIKIPSSAGAVLKGYGIGLFDLAPDVSTNSWNIKDNTIDVSARAGISAINFENAKIRSNPLIKNNAQKIAIEVYGGYQNEVECNPNISSAGYGVSFQDSPYFDNSCNTINASSVALQIFGDCDESKIRGNELEGTEHDLAYGNDNFTYANTGTQIYHRNRFTGGSSNFEAINYTTDVQVVQNSSYIVSTQSCGINSPADPEQMPTFQSNDPQWFTNQFGIASCSFTCPSNCVIVPGAEIPPMTGKDELVRTGTWGGSNLQEGAKWNSLRYLYRKINNQPQIPLGYAAFVQDNMTTSLGKVSDYDDLLQDVLQPNPAHQQALDQLRAQKASLIESLLTQQAWIWQGGNWVFDNNASLLAESTLQSLRQAEGQIDAVQISLSQPLIANIQNLQNMNFGISDNKIFESNQKLTNAMHLQILAQGLSYLPTESELSRIRAVADQCPLDGGIAVYQARAMMEAFTGEVLEDKAKCKKVENRGSTARLDEVTIAPNPASRVVTVAWGNKQYMNIKVFNALGGSIYDAPVEQDAETQSIDVADWVNGIYYIYLYDATGTTITKKLVINK
jgi:Secretion system C-terminal sorting domain